MFKYLALLLFAVPAFAQTTQDPNATVTAPTFVIVPLTATYYVTLLDAVKAAGPTVATVTDGSHVSLNSNGIALQWLYDPQCSASNVNTVTCSGSVAQGNLVLYVTAIPPQYATQTNAQFQTTIASLINSYVQPAKATANVVMHSAKGVVTKSVMVKASDIKLAHHAMLCTPIGTICLVDRLLLR